MYKIDHCARNGHSIYQGPRQRVCRTCDNKRSNDKWINSLEHRIYHKNWSANRYQRLKEIIVRAKARPCMDCHVQYNHWIMEFDHKNQKEKLFTIGRVGRMQTPETLKAEIAKCEVVCSNCHADRTHKSEYWKKALEGQKRNQCQS